MHQRSAREVFLEFREQAIWLQTCYNIYRALYESDEQTSATLRQTAPAFFSDINQVLVDSLLLQVGRLTDPPRGPKGQPNLTASHIVELLSAEGKLSLAIQDASSGLHRYRKLIVQSRNQIIAHADREVFLTGTVIGVHNREDVEAFFNDLYRFIDDVGQAVGTGPIDFTCTSGPGDALDLIAYLAKGYAATQTSQEATRK